MTLSPSIVWPLRKGGEEMIGGEMPRSKAFKLLICTALEIWPQRMANYARVSQGHLAQAALMALAGTSSGPAL